jgi:hypothetical protein
MIHLQVITLYVIVTVSFGTKLAHQCAAISNTQVKTVSDGIGDLLFHRFIIAKKLPGAIFRGSPKGTAHGCAGQKKAAFAAFKSLKY